MNDAQTPVAALRRLVADFVSARDWDQFHTPKNLAMSLAIEAAELMEHFQWLESEASRKVALQDKARTDVAEELADVLSYAFALANVLGIDVTTALHDKMVKNAAKYPAEEFRGRSG